MSVSKKAKSVLKFVLKIALSGAALYFVFKKIDVDEFKETIKSIHVGYFVLAFVMFNLSKLTASFRLKDYYKSQDLILTNTYNIRLYYIGMFYNLFLPGSVGGDAYKIYLLKQDSEVKTKKLISATLLDRLSGLVLLFLEATILFQFSSWAIEGFGWVKSVAMACGVLAIPAWYLIKKLIFNPNFLTVFWNTTHLSFWVQVGQVLTAYFLLLAIRVDTHMFDYLTLFMISSVVAVLPFTIGGVGARELVFLYGYEFLNVNKPEAVAFTLLFFGITAITSLSGFFLTFAIDNKRKST